MRKETGWFAVLTLAIAWALGFAWAFKLPIVSAQHRWWLIFGVMCAPGAVGFALAWFMRRETPRAVGFEYTGAAPWIVALLYPLALCGAAVALAYAVRAATGNAAFITYTPEHVGWQLFGHVERGANTVWLAFLETAVSIIPWLLVALIFRWRKLPWFVEAAAWIGGVFFWPGPLAAPNTLGEELGWRGFVVRIEKPLTGALVTMVIWSLFHLPVCFGDAQRGHYAQNLATLAAIGVAAVPFAALYLWSRSVWPCAVMHFAWNNFNPLILGDPYRGGNALFSGANWIFNGEGVFGFVLNGALAVFLLRRVWNAAPTQDVAQLPGVTSSTVT